MKLILALALSLEYKRALTYMPMASGRDQRETPVASQEIPDSRYDEVNGKIPTPILKTMSLGSNRD
jgi:hypothetical protein